MTAQKFWKIMGFQNMINSHDVQLVNSRRWCTPSEGNLKKMGAKD